MAVNPIGGAFVTTQTDGPHPARRATTHRATQPYLAVMEHVDTRKLVEAYVRFYPLFQKAYQDLGYPNGYFNDRLVEVIDHLLATPEVPAPIASRSRRCSTSSPIRRSKRSAGQKILMRMGPVNEARVKAKLREIRSGVTGQTLPR